MPFEQQAETTLDRKLLEGELRLVSFLQSNSEDDLPLTRDFVARLLPGPGQQSQDVQIPRYLALSYVWGKERTNIDCDEVPIEVSSNLVTALRHIQRRWPSSKVWTDCLCINQFDEAEKSHQVAMMSQIYRNAELVVVWLGENTEYIYQGLRRLGSGPEKKQVAIPFDTDPRLLIATLSSKDWFYRAWTFQEIRLASKAVVLFGSEMMDWQTFVSMVQALRQLAPHLSTTEIRSQPRSFSKYPYVLHDRFFSPFDDLNAGPSTNLAELLFLTWYRAASEKRDKVYSLLGTAMSTFDYGIKVDYKIPWHTLCIKTARTCINSSQSLKILRIAGMIQRRKSPNDQWDPQELSQLYSHPSWAPDWWKPPQQTRSLSSLAYDSRGVFGALDFCCPLEAPTQDIEDTTPILILDGVLLGIINVDQPPTFPGGNTLIHPPSRCADIFPAEWLQKSLAKDILKLSSDSPRGIAQVEMSQYVRLIYQHMQGDCSCVPFHQRQSPSFSNRSCTSTDFQRFPHTSISVHDVPRPPELAEADFPAQVIATSVESGDWLVLLPGGGLPFILRPARDPSGHGVIRTDMLGFNDVERNEVREKAGDAGVFVLVGEASMCWDRLWTFDWDGYCRAGKFLIL